MEISAPENIKIKHTKYQIDIKNQRILKQPSILSQEEDKHLHFNVQMKHLSFKQKWRANTTGATIRDARIQIRKCTEAPFIRSCRQRLKKTIMKTMLRDGISLI